MAAHRGGAGNGHADIVRLLIAHGADASAGAAADGAPPVMAAAQFGPHAAVLRALVQGGGADVDQKRRDGATTLLMAAHRGDAVATTLLCDLGADIEQRQSCHRDGARRRCGWRRRAGTWK